MPKSLIHTYPSEPNSKFSGFMSQWIIPDSWIYSSPATVHAITNPKINESYRAIPRLVSFLISSNT